MDQAASEPLPDFQAEMDAYDRQARAAVWDGPRYRMTYRVLGEGPPLVLVPGVAATYRGYAELFNRLAPHFQTVVYDYPGEAPGDGADLRSITHDDLLADLIGLCDHLGYAGRPVALLGVSFGSTLTLKALRRHPERFDRAALQGGFAYRPFNLAEGLAFAMGRLLPGRVGIMPFRETVLAWKHKSTFPKDHPERWSAYVEENGQTLIPPLAHRLALLKGVDLRPDLPRIEQPVCLIQGECDTLVPRPFHDELSRALPRATEHLLQGAGHQPHYTHASAMARIVAEELGGARPPS